MMSDKAKNKLKEGILFGLYKIYDSTNEQNIDSLVLTPLFKHNYDEHDIALALRSLKADGFISAEFSSTEIDDWSDTLSLTPKRNRILP